MAYRVTQRIISSDDPLYPYFDDLCRKSKLLYNAALFSCAEYLYRLWQRTSDRERSRSLSRSCVITTILSKHVRPQSDFLYTP